VGGGFAGLARARQFGLGALEERIPLKLGLDVGGKVELRQLQELDRLQELRRHYQGLALTHFQPLHQTHARPRCPSSAVHQPKHRR
jgi:hypothetical protein